MFKKILNKVFGIFGICIVAKPKTKSKTEPISKQTDSEYVMEMMGTVLNTVPIYYVQGNVGYRLMAIGFPPQSSQNKDNPVFRVSIDGSQMVTVQMVDSSYGDDDLMMDL